MSSRANAAEAAFADHLRDEVEALLRLGSKEGGSTPLQDLIERAPVAVVIVTAGAMVVNAGARALWALGFPSEAAKREAEGQIVPGPARLASAMALLEIGRQLARVSAWAFDRAHVETGPPVPVAEDVGEREAGNGELIMAVRLDGTRHAVRGYARPVHAGDGHVIAVATVFFSAARPPQADTTLRAREAHQRASFLARASTRLLSASLDPDEILRQMAAAVVPTVAESCIVDVIDDADEGRLRRVVTECVSADKAVLLDKLYALAMRTGESVQATLRVVRSGSSEMYPVIEDEGIRAIAMDEEQRTLLLDLAPRSVMVVPLLARHRAIGAVSLIRYSTARPFDDADLDMAEQLGLNAGLAAENAHLYQYEQQARAAIERAANRMRRLQSMMTDLATSLSSDDVARAVIHHGQLAVGGSAGLIWKLDPARQELHLVHSSLPASDEAVASYRVLAARRRGPVAWAVSSGEPVFISSPEELADRFVEAAVVVPAIACMPLVQQGEVRGVLAFTFDGPRTFDADERSFLTLVAAHGAQGLYRASVYEAEQKARSEAALLYALVAAANRSNTSAELYEASLDVVTRGLNADRVSILLDDEHGEPQFVAWRGLSDEYRNVPRRSTPWPLGNGPRTVVVEDVEHEPALGPFLEILRKEGIGALATFPLMHQGRRFGKLAVYSNHRRLFSEDDLRLAETIASQLAQSLVRKRAQVEVAEARAAAEHASQMKDEFLAVVSHELRTPLSSIMGWASILQTERRNDPAMLAKGLSVIERNAKAQATIIGDILDVSRIIRGKLALDAHPISVVPLVMDAVETLRTSAAAKGIKVDLDVRRDRFMLVGDPDRIRQVAWNLVSNAIKFSPPGSRVDVRLHRDADAIVLTVRDTGRGIAPEFLPHVFDRFRQADASTTRREGGLGLGLSIVRNLVELHGGQVAVESEGVGKGATFTATFPVRALATEQVPEDRAVKSAEPRPAAREHASLDETALEGLHVLVVDDQPDAREMMSEALASFGAKVDVAGSAAEAVDVLQKVHPEVLVTDIGMPGEDGFALLRRVRALPGPDGMLPAVAVTAFARAEDARRVLGAGFKSHVAKPARLDTLAHAVARAAGREASPGDAP